MGGQVRARHRGSQKKTSGKLSIEQCRLSDRYFLVLATELHTCSFSVYFNILDLL